MEKPYRYRKKLLRSGTSDYVLLPADWVKKHTKPGEEEVVLEVYKDHVKVLPVK